MGFEDIPLVRSYSSDSDDILNAFYVPVLENSHKYYRLAGFFSSTCLALAARGIVGLIRNNGVMKLIVSPRLSKKDVNAIIDSTENPIKYCENKMIEEFDKLENDFIRDHIFALGWMIANKKLKIKIALVYDKEGKLLRYDKIQEKGIFHQKVGILKDVEGKIISFSGSVNESAMGWMDNIEEFKVFRSWESGEEEYVASDYKRFKKFWRNESPRVEVIKSPVAIENKLIQIAPCHIKSIDIEKWYKKRSEKCVKLFKYQQEAINKWFENGKKGIFEMATGTGKTFTALGCVSKIKDADNKVVIVISSPYSHLSYQWKNELNKIGIEIHSIIADSTNRKWKTEITDYLTDIKLSYRQNLIIFTTHRTLSSNIFCKIIQQYKKSLGIPFFLIVDEVHGIGAEKSSIGLLEEYDYRLGLSATPKRWFDNEGTNIIYREF